MEKEDKIFDLFKSAAENAENKNFPGMDKVWNRVEEKLDKKILKKENTQWKKIAVAASVLLFGTLGYQFFKNIQKEINPNQTVTAIDSTRTTNSKTNAIVTADPINPAIKKEAVQILQEQINSRSSIGAVEAEAEERETNSIIAADSISNSAAKIGYSMASGARSEKVADKLMPQPNKTAFNEVEMLLGQKAKTAEALKEEPLVVIDNKVSKKSLSKLEFNDTDSLVVLNDPLYIINGVEYTEKEVFGPNPTSPYTPLNKQEIESLSILQDEKAIELYGEKGKKGVVLITTKNGKPASASKKAK